MERRVQEIELPGGHAVLARVSVLQPEEVPGDPDDFAYEDVGALDHLSARVDQLNELVGGVGSAVLEAARAVRPDEVSATFGVELAVKPGKAVALLADGEAKAAISVTLTWHPGTGSGAAHADLPASHAAAGGSGSANPGSASVDESAAPSTPTQASPAGGSSGAA